MTNCKACETQDVRRRVLAEYQAAELIGAPFSVLLRDAVKVGYCPKCGEVVDITVPNFDGLVATVAVARACASQKLNGPEIRFLRRAARWKGKDLADKLSVDPATISRWEHGAQTISDSCELHLRLRICAELGWFAPLVRFDPKVLEKLEIVPARDVATDFTIALWLDRGEARANAENVVAFRLPPQPCQIEVEPGTWESDGLPVPRRAA